PPAIDPFQNPRFQFALVRYNADGSLDLTFNGTGKVNTPITVNDRAWALALQTDGKIVVAGDTNDGNPSKFAVARYNSNGSLDSSFNGTGTSVKSFGSAAPGDGARA